MNNIESSEKFKLSQQLFYKNRCTEALAILDELTAESPESKDIAYSRALCLFVLGNGEEAKRICTALVTKSADKRANDLLKHIEEIEAHPIPTELPALQQSRPRRPAFRRPKTLPLVTGSLAAVSIMLLVEPFLFQSYLSDVTRSWLRLFFVIVPLFCSFVVGYVALRQSRASLILYAFPGLGLFVHASLAFIYTGVFDHDLPYFNFLIDLHFVLLTFSSLLVALDSWLHAKWTALLTLLCVLALVPAWALPFPVWPLHYGEVVGWLFVVGLALAANLFVGLPLFYVAHRKAKQTA